MVFRRLWNIVISYVFDRVPHKKIEAAVVRLIKDHETPAIAVMRPYPPSESISVQSHLGGRPKLPTNQEWPRASDGVALHFLASIHCAELPENDQLPSDGTLLFFARIDEEMTWDTQKPQDFSRVLHVSLESASEAPVPDDLPPIMGGYHQFDQDFLLPDEPPTRVYPKWPVQFFNVPTWPNVTLFHAYLEEEFFEDAALDRIVNDEYRFRAQRAQADGIAKAIGQSNVVFDPPNEEDWFQREDGRAKMQLPPDSGFPHTWIVVDRIARSLHRQCAQQIDYLKKWEPTVSAENEAMIQDLSKIQTDALRWISEAQNADYESSISEVKSSEFRTWLEGMMTPKRSEISYFGWKSMTNGLASAITFCGASQKTAALMPKAYFDHFRKDHSPVLAHRIGLEAGHPRPPLRFNHHQILGNPMPTQEHGEEGSVLLLHLYSDSGIGFMFCDVGEIQFRISHDDLAAGRFENVRAFTSGG